MTQTEITRTDKDTNIEITFFDNNGILCAYVPGSGVNWVDSITPEMGAAGDALFLQGAKDLDSRLGSIFREALERDDLDAQLTLEIEMMKTILSAPDAKVNAKEYPFGIAYSRAGYQHLFDTYHAVNGRAVVVSSTRVEAINMNISYGLMDFIRDMFCLPISEQGQGTFMDTEIRNLSSVNFTEFGSKKDLNAWKALMQKHVIDAYKGSAGNARLARIFEDHAGKLEAALNGAEMALGYRPQGYRMIR